MALLVLWFSYGCRSRKSVLLLDEKFDSPRIKFFTEKNTELRAFLREAERIHSSCRKCAC